MAGGDGEGEYLPLSVAAAIAYGSLVPADKAARDRAELDQHLDRLAAAICGIVPVFSTLTGNAPTILSPHDVARGIFRQGAQLLDLQDGSEPIEGLRVRNADLFLAIEQLRQRPPFGAN